MSHSGVITALLVEDDPAQAFFLEEILPESQVKIVHVSSLAEALQLVESRKFDVILQDLSLPDSDGLDTVQSILSHVKAVPIVILTGLSDEDIAIQAVQLGAQDYIPKKEITASLLLRSIRYAIERKRAEELAVERERALEASKLKSVFLGNMSHEFRTPLSGILGMNNLLLGSNLTAEQWEYASMVQSCAQDLLEMISDILDISSIELGGIIIRHQPVNPLAALQAVEKVVSASARGKNLEVEVQYDQDLPENMLGDQLRVEQVLTCLARNAVKFTKAGKIRLATSIASQDADFTTIKFSISDTGIGIAEEEQRLLFMAFTQVDSSSTRRYGGLGLGLAISKRLVELMGGRIGVDSQKDAGSTFWFTIPFRHEHGNDRIFLPENMSGVSQSAPR